MAGQPGDDDRGDDDHGYDDLGNDDCDDEKESSWLHTSLWAGSLPRHWLAATTVEVVASPASRKSKSSSDGIFK